MRFSGFFARLLGFIWSSGESVLAFFRECSSDRRMRQKPKKIEKLDFSKIGPKWYLGGCLRCLKVGNAFFRWICAHFGFH